MTTPQNEMRAKFEAWYIDHAMNEVAMVFTPDEMVRLRDGDQYGDHHEYLNARWSEWQLLSDFYAATAAQAEALAAVTRERDALREDAERWRFASEVGFPEFGTGHKGTWVWYLPAEMDAGEHDSPEAVIDAARATLTPTAPGAQEQA